MKIPRGERTPMLEQYMVFKNRHEDAILFYRMGDFYEMFYDDARIASEVCGLRLTSRAHGKVSKVPLAGFPYHQLDNYSSKMVKAGYRVVIVDQVEDPKKAKGLVKRDVVRIATAGTNPADIERDEPSLHRIASIIRGKHNWGYAWTNIATGEFFAGEFSHDNCSFISGQVDPVELIVPETEPDVGPAPVGRTGQPMVSKLVDWVWEVTFARKTLVDHFGTIGLKGFGIENLDLAVSAAGALLYYLKGNLRSEIHHLTTISRAEVSGRLFMEPATKRNLELTESLSENPQATLFSVIDQTVTGPGRRALYSRLLEPLTDKIVIDERLDSVEELKRKPELRNKLRILLRKAGDLLRHLARLSTGRGSARDLVAIHETLALLPDFKTILAGAECLILESINGRIENMEDLVKALADALVENPPLSTTEAGMIRAGYDSKVDELRNIRDGGRSWIKQYEADQKKLTGIPNLKVKYNKVFGYFIEISKSQIEKAPAEYSRRQTLVSAERYTTVELSSYESKLLSAEDEINTLENKIFQRLAELTLNQSWQLQENAHLLAELDVTAALAELAESGNYCRPVITTDTKIILKDSRHPVVEMLLPPGEQFVPNDLQIGEDGSFIHILTGPNMAGKSTYLRQIAIITILAQMGSFVPAAEAEIGLVDKLFTRIGALDNLAGGESTFLVEMHETASILNNATEKSLVLFDEIGRGTSTFDGLSLAWAIVEYIHENQRLRPRTLFATHFHEMVDLEEYLSGVENRNVAVREYDDRVVFLRKIIAGGCNRSFGIHVAKMAGLPPEVIQRANEVLNNLEANDINPRSASDSQPDQNDVITAGSDKKTGGEKNGKAKLKSKKETLPRPHIAQLSLFDPIERKLRELLHDVDPDALTPLEALKLISELKKYL